MSRQRLVDRLQRRFDVRVTLVVGGAGSGKTTLLAQVMSAEADHVDVWVPCRSVDRDPQRLYAQILGALEPDDVAAGDGALDRIAELIVGMAPRQVCIVLDDTHLLGDGTVPNDVLASLPANGHLLLAGRSRPAIHTARFDAAGELEEITQAELMMTDDEVIAFANLRGVDVDTLRTADGWPAFVELASSGTASRSTRYLDEEALRGITPERRRRLAAFAFIGGGDDELALAVTGCTLSDLLADVPLVRWHGDAAQLHDLWVDLLGGALTPEERLRAVHAATAVLRERRLVDRAIDLAVAVDDWDDVTVSLRTALRDGVDGGVRLDQLQRWRALLPAGHEPAAIRSLIDGLIARERDPTSVRAFEHMEDAAAGFADIGDPELELAALTQLGYLARIVHDTAAVESVAGRLERLAQHHPPAIPFRAIGEAWVALTTSEPQRRLDALLTIPEGALPPTWDITRRHLIAHALFNLGRADEGLEIVPEHIDELPVAIPGALSTRSQCLWYAGFPERALAEPVDGASHRHGVRDRFIARGWLAAMLAYSGDGSGARMAMAEAAGFMGEQPGPLVQAQVAGIEILALVADGDEEQASRQLRAILDLAPLGDGFAEHLLREHFPMSYLLLPETHDFWNGQAMPPRWVPIRELSRLLADIRAGGDVAQLARSTWPSPGLIAAHLPSRWAIELAVHGVRAGRTEARRLADWLCEHWGAPARDRLAELSDDPVCGPTATELLAETPTPPVATVEFGLLGPTDFLVEGQRTTDADWRRERVRALLTWCVLHPLTTREQAAAALWPDIPHARAAKNLRTTLNYLHGVLEPGRAAGGAPWYLRSDTTRLTLHPSLPCDLVRFRELLDRAADAEARGQPRVALPLMQEALELWRGDLAEDLDHDWLDLERIHLRSRYVRAASRVSELLLVTGHPEQAADAARRAIGADPYHEPSYRSLAEVYRAMGDLTSAKAVTARHDELLRDG